MDDNYDLVNSNKESEEELNLHMFKDESNIKTKTNKVKTNKVTKNRNIKKKCHLCVYESRSDLVKRYVY
jgi:Pyruvate/2-oxoacid:ferredoxin oxidoreductase delta subunit